MKNSLFHWDWMLTAGFGMLGASYRMLEADFVLLGAGIEMLDAK